MEKDTQFEVLKKYRSFTEAELARICLELENIPSKVTPRRTHDLVESRAPDSLVVIRVPHRSLERAKAALAQMSKTKGVPLS